MGFWQASSIVTRPSGTQNTIQPTADTANGLVIERHSATQSANLLEWQNETGGILSRVGPGGEAVFSTGNTAVPTLTVIGPPKTANVDALLVQDSSLVNLLDIRDMAGASTIFNCGRNTDSNCILQFRAAGVGSGNGPFMSWIRGGTERWQFGVDAANPGGTNAFWWFDVQGGAYRATLSLAGAFILTPTAPTTPLTLQGAASQTAPLMQLTQKSSTAANRPVGVIDGAFAVSTDASRQGRLLLEAVDFAATREGMRIEATGTAAAIGFLGAAAVVRQTGASAAGIAAITDASAKAAVSALQTALANLGLVTSPA